MDRSDIDILYNYQSTDVLLILLYQANSLSMKSQSFEHAEGNNCMLAYLEMISYLLQDS